MGSFCSCLHSALVYPTCIILTHRLSLSRATQGSLSRTMSSRGLKISKDGDSTTSLGSLTTCSREVFSVFSLNFMWFLIFNVCPLFLVPSVGTSEKMLDPSALFPPIRYLHTLIKPSQVVLIFDAEGLSFLSLSSSVRCSSSLAVFMAHHEACSSKSMCSLHWGAQNWTQRPRHVLTSTAWRDVGNRAIYTSLELLAVSTQCSQVLLGTALLQGCIFFFFFPFFLNGNL